ncbi:DUF5011 domain-containing protein [Bifidobacterium biavatii]|nr:DUF5011 domain-containing protein [Bifidobacterium biavatii]
MKPAGTIVGQSWYVNWYPTFNFKGQILADSNKSLVFHGSVIGNGSSFTQNGDQVTGTLYSSSITGSAGIKFKNNAFTTPEIKGATDKTIDKGSVFDPKAGVTASSKRVNSTTVDDLTSSITVDGTVDVNRVGSYVLTYSVTNLYGVTTTVKRTITVKEPNKPVITGVLNKTIEAGGTFDPKAGVTANDVEDGDLTSKIVITGTVDPKKTGAYTLTYKVTDKDGHTVSVDRTITVVDTTKPVITGALNKTIEAGTSFDPKQGVTASDTVDGDLTSQIKTSGTVNTSKPGSYTITYTVSDKSGNTTTVSRVITVVDTTKPVLKTPGDVTIHVGDTFDPKAGVTASDTVDGDLTSKIQVTGSADTSTPGKYTITYKVTDNAGNTTTATRTVTVVAVNVPVIKGATSKTVEAATSFDKKAGVTASDVEDGDLTSKIQVTGDVNLKKTGSYTLTYTVTDKDGHTTTVSRVITVVDTTKPVITGAADKTITEGKTFDPKQGVTATDTLDGDLTPKLQITGTVDVTKPGKYTVKYNVSDAAGNKAIEVTRTITVTAANKPVIKGASAKTVEAATSFDPKAGVTASDVEDGDLTSKIQVTGDVNLKKTGSYTLTYKVTDKDGWTTTVTRVVTVVDTTKPTISGATAKTIVSGTQFDPKAGVTASDTLDGDLTSKITVTGSVDSAKPGSYELTYSVSDKAGNTATVKRVITVNSRMNTSMPKTGGNAGLVLVMAIVVLMLGMLLRVSMTMREAFTRR